MEIFKAITKKGSWLFILLLIFGAFPSTMDYAHAQDAPPGMEGRDDCEVRISSTGKRKQVKCSAEFVTKLDVPRVTADATIALWKALHMEEGWTLASEDSSIHELSGPFTYRVTATLIYHKVEGDGSSGADGAIPNL